ncbi:hypothetical protein L2750_05080 [Shewanella submarina]|uniref:Flagellar hook-length control protein FliK n=1 Tax=Shewanella submarina TaxID=2016376 RepID=A0ABV7GH81_9GAMM|nr:hypothetical protein [Shewanella submarina]MCL1036525.1 hypothetical protein [Shewanella submarina]
MLNTVKSPENAASASSSLKNAVSESTGWQTAVRTGTHTLVSGGIQYRSQMPIPQSSMLLGFQGGQAMLYRLGTGEQLTLSAMQLAAIQHSIKPSDYIQLRTEQRKIELGTLRLSLPHLLQGDSVIFARFENNSTAKVFLYPAILLGKVTRLSASEQQLNTVQSPSSLGIIKPAVQGSSSELILRSLAYLYHSDRQSQLSLSPLPTLLQLFNPALLKTHLLEFNSQQPASASPLASLLLSLLGRQSSNISKRYRQSEPLQRSTNSLSSMADLFKALQSIQLRNHSHNAGKREWLLPYQSKNGPGEVRLSQLTVQTYHQSPESKSSLAERGWQLKLSLMSEKGPVSVDVSNQQQRLTIKLSLPSKEWIAKAYRLFPVISTRLTRLGFQLAPLQAVINETDGHFGDTDEAK